MRILLVVFLLVLVCFMQQISSYATRVSIYDGVYTVKSDTTDVLKILENKCNTCHKQKKKVVFTNDNLSVYYLLIEEQVFIKKRMPKGKKNNLTESEKLVIANWIQSFNN